MVNDKKERYREYVINDIYSNIIILRLSDQNQYNGVDKKWIKLFGFLLTESSCETFKSHINGENRFYNMNVIRVWEELKEFLSNRYGLTEDEVKYIFLNIDFKLCSNGEEREI